MQRGLQKRVGRGALDGMFYALKFWKIRGYLLIPEKEILRIIVRIIFPFYNLVTLMVKKAEKFC